MPDSQAYILARKLLALLETHTVDYSWEELGKIGSVLRECDRSLLEIARLRAIGAEQRLDTIRQALLPGLDRPAAAGGAQSASEPPPADTEPPPAAVVAPNGRKRRQIESFYVTEGPFKGMHNRRTVLCRFCQTKVRIHEAMKAGWESVNCCLDCQDALLKRVRGGSNPSNRWEGVPNDAPVWCDGCNHRTLAEFVRKSWPLPDLCDACAKEAEPEKVNHREDEEGIAVPIDGGRISSEDADRLRALARGGKLLVAEPVVSITQERAELVGGLIHTADAALEGAVEGFLALGNKAENGQVRVSAFKAERQAMNTPSGKRDRAKNGFGSRTS